MQVTIPSVYWLSLLIRYIPEPSFQNSRTPWLFHLLWRLLAAWYWPTCGCLCLLRRPSIYNPPGEGLLWRDQGEHWRSFFPLQQQQQLERPAVPRHQPEEPTDGRPLQPGLLQRSPRPLPCGSPSPSPLCRRGPHVPHDLALLPYPWPSGGRLRVARPWLCCHVTRSESSGGVASKWQNAPCDEGPSATHKGSHARWYVGGAEDQKQKGLDRCLDWHMDRYYCQPFEPERQKQEGIWPGAVEMSCVEEALWRSIATRQLLLCSISWGRGLSIAKTKLHRKFCWS